MMSQLTFATATGVVAVGLAVGVTDADADAVGQIVEVADTVRVGVAALVVAVTTVVPVTEAVGVGRTCRHLRDLWSDLLPSGLRSDNLVADTADVVPAADEAVVDAVGDEVTEAVGDAGADAVDDAGADAVDDAAAAAAGTAVELDAVVDGGAQTPAAERLRWPDPPISFRPMTRPTTSARARGTAIRATRALCDRADQGALRI